MATIMTANDGGLGATDAFNYLEAVRAEFVNEPGVYSNFLDVMKNFKSLLVDTPGVMERISTLFSGHADLIRGFNRFLPPGYHINCNTQDAETLITFEMPYGVTVQQEHTDAEEGPRNTTFESEEFHQAVQYVEKVKARFGNDPEKYKHFLEILSGYRREYDNNNEEVYAQTFSQIEILFQDEQDLLAEFKDNFLPRGSSGASSVSRRAHRKRSRTAGGRANRA
ncbi:PAH2 domain-containing protein [Schizopora paradoxa]|uniref:PAH2 domain-containing protein n=1 Tax=Schizopora paradoxa TaxID=27342 RepID=A0A0H2RMP4_9AGAM|nr:PAH2 domain-containing protein [Schizopora paradoxa]